MCVICLGRYVPTDDNTLDISGCQKIEKLEVPNGVEEVYTTGCQNLKEIILCDSVQLLSCVGCRLLENIIFSRNIILKELYANECFQLTKIDIPTLEYLECKNCVSLKEIYTKNFTRVIICHDCIKLEILKMEEGLLNLECNNCTNLRQLNLPSSLNYFSFVKNRSLTRDDS